MLVGVLPRPFCVLFRRLHCTKAMSVECSAVFFYSCRSAGAIASLFKVASVLRFLFGLRNFAICDTWPPFVWNGHAFSFVQIIKTEFQYIMFCMLLSPSLHCKRLFNSQKILIIPMACFSLMMNSIVKNYSTNDDNNAFALMVVMVVLLRLFSLIERWIRLWFRFLFNCNYCCDCSQITMLLRSSSALFAMKRVCVRPFCKVFVWFPNTTTWHDTVQCAAVTLFCFKFGFLHLLNHSFSCMFHGLICNTALHLTSFLW